MLRAAIDAGDEVTIETWLRAAADATDAALRSSGLTATLEKIATRSARLVE